MERAEKDYSEKAPPQLTRSASSSSEELGEVGVVAERYQYKKVFSPRSLQAVALGSNIASGLFISIGSGLHTGGPGGMLVGYGIVVTIVCCVLQTMTEMTIAFPCAGNLLNHADRWVDPALAFTTGFALWIGWTAVIASEATMFVVMVNMWAQDHVNEAVWLTIFLILTFGLFCFPSRWFAIFEYISALIKIPMFLILVCACIAICAGAGPTGEVHDGATWRDYDAFSNGFKGISKAMLLGVWAMGDQVMIGMMGAEVQNPRLSMGRSATMVPYRLSVVYGVSILLISMLVPMDDARLFGGSGVAASPFVIAIQDAGIPVLADLLNAVIMFAQIAMSAESLYIGSRALQALSAQKLIHPCFGDIDAHGRPRLALAVTGVIGGMLTYINLSNTGAEVYTWFVSVTSSSFICIWIIMALTSWRFHAAVRAQQDPLFAEPYAWRCRGWPLPALYQFLGSVLLLVACFYIGLSPIGTTTLSVYNFFQYTIGVLIMLAGYVGYKLLYRTPLRAAAEADLVTGRRHLGPEDVRALDAYYGMPRWRRGLSYVTLW